jgi:hypothetical protein
MTRSPKNPKPDALKGEGRGVRPDLRFPIKKISPKLGRQSTTALGNASETPVRNPFHPEAVPNWRPARPLPFAVVVLSFAFAATAAFATAAALSLAGEWQAL